MDIKNSYLIIFMYTSFIVQGQQKNLSQDIEALGDSSVLSSLQLNSTKGLQNKEMNFEQGVNTIIHKYMEMLNWAEILFGKRDEGWTFIGIEFRDDVPHIRYYPYNKISIVLSSRCSKGFPTSPQLYYQLSHEICHLLYPSGKADANVLNEGISTYFSQLVVEKEYPGTSYAINNIKKSIYYDPYLLVKKLLLDDKDAIKKIREVNSKISQVTFDEMKSLNFNLSDEDIEKITDKFKY